MIKGVGVDTRALFVLLIVMAILVSVAGFAVKGQENIVDQESDELSENVEESLDEASTEEVIGEIESEEIIPEDSEQAQEEELAEDMIEEVQEGAIQESIDENETESEEIIPEDVFINIEELELNAGEVPEGSINSGNDADSEEGDKTLERVIGFNITDIVEGNNEEHEEEKIRHILYKAGKKEIETEIDEGEELVEIIKEESILEENDLMWKKNVKVFSEEHFDNSLVAYTDIPESELDEIHVYHLEGEKEASFDHYDINENGQIDRIGIHVPHLSEQNFEITINFNEGDTNSTNLTLQTINAPSGVIDEVSILDFEFNISYNNLDETECSLEIKDSSDNVEFFAEGFNNNSWGGMNSSTFENDDYSWEAFCLDINMSDKNDSEEGAFTIDLDYSLHVSFGSNVNTIVEDNPVTFSINISTLDNRTVSYFIAFGDGNVTSPVFTGNVFRQIDHVYVNPGNYTAVLTVTDPEYNQAPTYNKQITVTSGGDITPPAITLLEPADNAVLGSSQIDFHYRVVDSSTISNCTYNLYYFNNSNVGELVYNETNRSVSSNVTDIVEMVNFDEGDYTWEIECYDSLNNYNSADRSFEYISNSSQNDDGNNDANILNNNTTYERSDEVEELIELINQFLIDSGKYGKEEREVVDDLGIIDDMVFYKKKLNQIKLDLQHNIDFISDEERREERRGEVYAEIDEIKRNAVVRVEVVESQEYVKNSLDVSMESVVESYIKSKNLVLGERAAKKLAKYNEEIQNSVSVSVYARHVEIENYEEIKKITLITKEPKKSDETESTFLEVVPKEIANDADEITFVNDFSVIEKDPILEIKESSLKNGKIVYYVDGFKDLEDVEGSDTLLFSEKIPDGASAISGFSVLLDSASSGGFMVYFSWIIVISVFLVGGFFAVNRMKLNKYRENDEIRAIFGMIKDAERSLEMKDITAAKGNYDKIRELYSFVPDNGRLLVYRKIDVLRVNIDKREVGELMRECIAALREGRKDAAALIYEEIQGIYHRMPKKYQNKIYEKMLPYVYMLRN